MKSKTSPKDQHTIDDFLQVVLVVCPRCSEKAVVELVDTGEKVRLTCGQCGLTRKKVLTVSTIGGAADPYFRLPLWLQESCSIHTVWAYNPDHLSYLKQYIQATDRRRPTRSEADPLNKLLSSRLLRWMQSAKNRDRIVKAIAAIESRLHKTEIE